MRGGGGDAGCRLATAKASGVGAAVGSRAHATRARVSRKRAWGPTHTASIVSHGEKATQETSGMAIVANASGGQSCSRGNFSFVDAA